MRVWNYNTLIIAIFIESNSLGEASRIRRLLVRSKEEENLRIEIQKSELDDSGSWYAHLIAGERPNSLQDAIDRSIYSTRISTAHDEASNYEASVTTNAGTVVASEWIPITRASNSGVWVPSWTTNGTGNN